ncbi:hypothetical protein R4T87_004603 [Salmonella enterica]|nr:hypothetical protein [Salmonella enterica]
MYQFIHIEDYGKTVSKKKKNDGKNEKYKKETKGRSVREIIAEAKREPGNCPHVEKPQDPLLLYGVGLDEVEKLAYEYHDKTKIIDKNGKEKKLRTDANILLAGVISLNRDNEDIWGEYKNDAIEFLKNKYGKKLVSVIEHTDEKNPHFHFYIIQKPGLKFDLIHDGKKALFENRDKKKHDQNIAYIEAMRSLQEDFFKVVSSNYGLTKDGPKRARLSRSDYFKQSREVRLLNQVKVKAKKEGYKFAIDDFENKNWFNKITTATTFKKSSLENALNENKDLVKKKNRYKKLVATKNTEIEALTGYEKKYNDLRKDFKVRVNNQTEMLRNEKSLLSKENEEYKNKNTILEKENNQLKTDIEEYSTFFEKVKSAYGDRFEEWKANVFKALKSAIKPK